MEVNACHEVYLHKLGAAFTQRRWLTSVEEWNYNSPEIATDQVGVLVWKLFSWGSPCESQPIYLLLWLMFLVLYRSSECKDNIFK